MQLAQIVKIVGCIAPVDTGGAAKLGCHVNMSKYNHVAFLIYTGVIGNDCVVTVLAGTDALGTGGVAMGFNYRISTGGVPLIAELAIAALTTVAAGGYTIANATDDNEIMVIEMDASELVAPTTNYYVGVNLSAAAASLECVIALCMEPRYMAAPNLMPSAVVA